MRFRILTSTEDTWPTGRGPSWGGATERTGSTQGWQATEDGVALRCSDSPLAYLLMGRDPELLQRAEAALAAQVPTLTPF